MVDHKHPNNSVRWLNFSPCNKYLVSTANDSSCLWVLGDMDATLQTTLPCDEVREEGATNVSACSIGGKMVAVTRGDMQLTIYKINGDSASVIAVRDLETEVQQTERGTGFKYGKGQN